MGVFAKLITGAFTKAGIIINDGEYFYQSSTSPQTYSFSVRDNGKNIIITNDYDGTPDFLVYQENGKYKNSSGMIFSFQMVSKGVYTGGLMGKNMGTAKLIRNT